MGQVRVFSTHFEKNKGQKVKLKGHQYSFLAAIRVLIMVASTHFWPKQGYLPLRYSQFKILVIQYIFVFLFENFVFLSLSSSGKQRFLGGLRRYKRESITYAS